MTGEQPELSGFAERLLAVIDEGRRTATYKLAVLLALMDCCAEGVSPSGLAPAEIPTRALARKVAALYWRSFGRFRTTASCGKSPTTQRRSSRRSTPPSGHSLS